ncbi:MAG: hypothetical protein N2652_10600 [Kiritimatiellae bacterium]|nr:hypothetical protein [Kiritimatiellia bacterium]
MTIVDLHVHWHGYYDPASLWCEIVPRMQSLGGPSAARVLCWTEAAGCREFERLMGGGGPWVVARVASEGRAVWIADETRGGGIWIVRGQQIVTAERLEILAIGVRDDALEGRPSPEVVQQLEELGAPALIPWAPGKWWGRRGRMIRALLARWPRDVLMLVDSSLRPRGWPMPRLLRRSAAREGRLLAGSDPLEYPGEERRIASYATLFSSPLAPEDPAGSLVAMLRDRRIGAVPVGSRAGPLVVGWRIARHMRRRSGAKREG